MKKLTHKYVENYYLNEKYILNSIYNGNKNKDNLICPEGHNIEMTFGNFKSGYRCDICSGLKKHSHKYVENYYKKYNYTIVSIYNGNKNKDNLICPEGHNIEMKFNVFQRGHRCNICYRENNIGENHPKFNPNREELPLNQRLRIKSFTKDWIIKNMKDDPNYEKFLLNPDDYVIDHIIPVSLFCKLFTKYNLNEYQVKQIINIKDNLQLLTWKENFNKFNKGSSLFEATQYLINNGIPFEKFLEENNI